MYILSLGLVVYCVRLAQHMEAPFGGTVRRNKDSKIDLNTRKFICGKSDVLRDLYINVCSEMTLFYENK